MNDEVFKYIFYLWMVSVAVIIFIVCYAIYDYNNFDSDSEVCVEIDVTKYCTTHYSSNYVDCVDWVSKIPPSSWNGDCKRWVGKVVVW